MHFVKTLVPCSEFGCFASERLRLEIDSASKYQDSLFLEIHNSGILPEYYRVHFAIRRKEQRIFGSAFACPASLENCLNELNSFSQFVAEVEFSDHVCLTFQGVPAQLLDPWLFLSPWCETDHNNSSDGSSTIGDDS